MVGLLVGAVTGLTLGINIASWNFAGVIVESYAEIIHSNDAMFAKINNSIYELIPVQSHDIQDSKDIEPLPDKFKTEKPQ